MLEEDRMAAEKEIRERLLEQAIPSDYMRNFYRSIDVIIN